MMGRTGVLKVRAPAWTEDGSLMNDGVPPVEVIVLGSGTSHGVPMIGCTCAVCTSGDPRDQRTRPSIFVRMGDQRILVDTATELRLQCITHNIDRVDAVLFTHHHADHVTGLDDVRRFNWLMRQPLQCYGSERTLRNLRQMFLYAFEHAPDSPHSRPELELHPIDDQPFRIGGETIVPIPLVHGSLPVLGFRFGDFAYCTDCNDIPDESLSRLGGLDVLILEAVRRTPHPAHFHLDGAVEMARRIGARRTYFTHIAHQLGHEETNRELPDGMALAYDGLRFST
jgi:phosphoribosyl 1,2-cyclic phosphate phosphodiesterase